MGTPRTDMRAIARELEDRAADIALGATGASRWKRRDVPGANSVRDYDLHYSDRPAEPLEIKGFVNGNWLRFWDTSRKDQVAASGISRHWIVMMRSSASPMRDLIPNLLLVLRELERLDVHTAAPWREDFSSARQLGAHGDALRELIRLDVDRVGSVVPRDGYKPDISISLGDGGVVRPSLILDAVEASAARPDVARKLAVAPDAALRHLFVRIDSSQFTHHRAMDYELPTEAPNLPEIVNSILISNFSSTFWFVGGEWHVVQRPDP